MCYLLILLLSAAVLGAKIPDGSITRRQASNDDPSKASPTTIFVSYPACDFYRCAVTWPRGLDTYVNWLNSPVGGNVSVTLASETHGSDYTIAAGAPAVLPSSSCDSGSGLGVAVSGRTCGRVNFVVPNGWQNGNYSVTVQSLSDPNVIGYTDFVLIVDGNSTTSTTISGTSVSLETTPSPTGITSTASSTLSENLPPSPTTVVSSQAISSNAHRNHILVTIGVPAFPLLLAFIYSHGF